MCDYSLQTVRTRDATVGDKLITRDFGTGTRGFGDIDEFQRGVIQGATAVCVLPGTELAFDEPIERSFSIGPFNTSRHRLARFRQVNKEVDAAHHDALEMPDGEQILLNHLACGQTATVLQLPAKPKTEAEAQEQKRIPVKA